VSTSPTEVTETLRVTRFFGAPRDRVFRAWTVAEEFRQWWGPGRRTTAAAEMDVRTGGRYRITMQRPDGKRESLFGTYLEVSPPERLVMTWSLEGTETNDGYEARVTLEFKIKGTGTEVVLVHERLPRRSVSDYDKGWEVSFEQLDRHLTKRL
jgi:uncharacterized protein YndB with AHSA1/START domain